MGFNSQHHYGSISGPQGHRGRSVTEIIVEDIPKMKERALTVIVRAIMELEDYGKLNSITLYFHENGFELKDNRNFTTVKCLRDSISIDWLSSGISLKRAKSEEEYFQLMCLDDMYCDEEIEEGIKQLFELYIKNMSNKYAIGGFREGAYAEDNTDSE
jgi:hypothetical protein